MAQIRNRPKINRRLSIGATPGAPPHPRIAFVNRCVSAQAMHFAPLSSQRFSVARIDRPVEFSLPDRKARSNFACAERSYCADFIRESAPRSKPIRPFHLKHCPHRRFGATDRNARHDAAGGKNGWIRGEKRRGHAAAS